MPPALERALLAAAADVPQPLSCMPERVPLLSLRDTLLSVDAVAPVSVTRARSRVAVERALGSDRWLGLFCEIGADPELPGESELHRVGTLAFVSAAIPHGADYWLVVRGHAWLRLLGVESGAAYAVARVDRFVVREESSVEVTRLEQALRSRVRAFAQTLPDPEPVLDQVARMSALELADATIANLGCDLAEKARYVSESSLLARLEQVIALTERSF